jgi:hypothetical protein
MLPEEGRGSEAGAVVRRWSGWRSRFFTKYAAMYLGRHFGGVYLRRGTCPSVVPGRHGCRRVVVVMNHPSWWDPLVAMVLKREWFGDVPVFGGMAAEELDRYPFFKRLGLFPVRKGAAGARDWKEAMLAVAGCERAVLWTTPQGRFVDVRERGVPLMPGVAMTGELQQGCVYLPVAVEYASGRARLPDVYASVGEAVEAESMRGLARVEVADRLRRALEAEQDALAKAVCAGDPLQWEAVRTGRRGLGSVYGWWRRLVGGKAVGEVGWEEVSRGGRRA